MEVSPRLHRITCRIGSTKPLYQHVVTGDDAWLWVDAGVADTPSTCLAAYLGDELGPPPARQLALVTHADVDHFGGLAQLRSSFPALLVMAHELDAPLIADHEVLMAERYLMHRAKGVEPAPWRQHELLDRAGSPGSVDVCLRGGETIDLGAAGRWRVVHLPGHSAGHIGVWEPQRREMILGDAALGWGVQSVDGQLMGPPPYYDVAQYLGTVGLLEHMGIATLYTSHFPIMQGAEINAFLRDCRHAVEAIGSAVDRARNDADSLEELCQSVAGELDRWPTDAWLQLADAVAAHLEVTAGAA